MKEYYKSAGKFIGQNKDSLYQIQTSDDVVGLPDFLYFFWKEFVNRVEVHSARSDIVISYGIDDEIFDDMVSVLAMDDLLLIETD